MTVTVSAKHCFPVNEAIVRRARRVRADLIVAECHAGPHVAPALLHLADWELLQMSPLPVLLVKSSRPHHDPIVRAAIDPTHAFSSPTRLDGEILRNSAGIQRALRGTLHTVHAYLPLPLKVGTGAAAHAKKGFERALWTTHIPRARCHLIEKSAGDTRRCPPDRQRNCSNGRCLALLNERLHRQYGGARTQRSRL
jgi:hypothetical protein